MIKLLIYFNHYNTLGHSQRVFSIVRELKQRFKGKIRVAILQGGGKHASRLLSRQAPLHILPHALGKSISSTAENKRAYRQLVAGGRMEKMLKDRLAVVKNVAGKLKPNIFMIEHFPFGQEFWSFEIPHVVRYLKDNYGCKVAGSSGYLGWIPGQYEYVRDLYDILLVHSPREFSRGYRRYLRPRAGQELQKVLRDFSQKIFFTGFIVEPAAGKKRIKVKPPGYKYSLLVSRGGGHFGLKIILASLLLARRRPDTYFVVSAGPLTPASELKRIMQLAAASGNVRLVSHLEPQEFEAYLSGVDVSINLSGYNTIARLLYYRKKSIIIPFAIYEQAWRAQIAKKYLNCQVLDYDRLSVSRLEAALNKLIDKDPAPLADSRKLLRGAADTRRMLTCFLKESGIF